MRITSTSSLGRFSAAFDDGRRAGGKSPAEALGYLLLRNQTLGQLDVQYTPDAERLLTQTQEQSSRLGPIAKRPYYCPMCGHEEGHETNHQGEIYCHCKACNSCPLYCSEIDAHAGLPFITAKLHFYRFNIEKIEEEQAYFDLHDKLKQQGLHLFDVIQSHQTSQAEQKHDGETVRLFNPNQWPEQFVSNIGRLHSWKQVVVPNCRIKTGYYLEFDHPADSCV